MISRIPDLIGASFKTLYKLILQGIAGGVQLLRNLLLQLETWLLVRKHALYGIAITRIILGTTILGFLAANWSTRLYTFGAGSAWTGQFIASTSNFATIFPFSIFTDAAETSDLLFTALYLLLALAALSLTIGYRWRLALIVVFILWVGVIATAPLVADQSDNMTRIMMIIFMFMAPADRWSVDSWRRNRLAKSREMGTAPKASGFVFLEWWRFDRVLPEWFTNLFHNLGIAALASQVFFVYVSGGLYKAGGKPWSGGYAIYNPIQTIEFGTWPELSDLITRWGPSVAFITTLTLLVQIGFPLMLMRRGTRIIALVVILGFHIGIAVIMGLPFFSLTMIAIDAIFIRDITWQRMMSGLQRTWRLTYRVQSSKTMAAPALKNAIAKSKAATGSTK